MVINPIVGVYIPIIRIPIKGGMTIPNIATFDHGTYGKMMGKIGPERWDKKESNPMTDPCNNVWYIYLHEWLILMVN